MGRPESQSPLSKKHSARRKRRKRRPGPVACPSCHTAADDTPGAFLVAMAACLNSAADAGMKVRVRHGVIMAEGRKAGGYVLAGGRDGRWKPAYLTYDPLAPVPAADDLDE